MQLESIRTDPVAHDHRPGHLVTTLLNGYPVGVQVAHRWTGEVGGPALLTFNATVALTAEEVTAVLFDWLWAGESVEELAEADRVRSLVAETLVNDGCSRVDLAMATAHTSDEVALLAYCHQRALAVFGPEDCGLRDAADPGQPGGAGGPVVVTGIGQPSGPRSSRKTTV